MELKSGQIVGTGQVVALSTGIPGFVAGNRCQTTHIQYKAPATNGAAILIGGSEVTSAVGFPLNPGDFQFAPPHGSDITNFYDLTLQKAYVPAGSILNFLYGL
jgi:hypothetical protein